MWDRILPNARFLVDNNETCSHLVDESIRTKKYLNGPLGGSIGPHISTFICSKKFGIDLIVFDIAGLVIIFPCEHAIHCCCILSGVIPLGMPVESLIILLYILVPGWPSLLCHILVMSGTFCII